MPSGAQLPALDPAAGEGPAERARLVGLVLSSARRAAIPVAEEQLLRESELVLDTGSAASAALLTALAAAIGWAYELAGGEPRPD